MINQLNELVLVHGRFILATKTIEHGKEWYRIVDMTDMRNPIIGKGRASDKGIITLLNIMIGQSKQEQLNNSKK